MSDFMILSTAAGKNFKNMFPVPQTMRIGIISMLVASPPDSHSIKESPLKTKLQFLFRISEKLNMEQ